jgi:NitT/TauT family transport system substrate-binding protein
LKVLTVQAVGDVVGPSAVARNTIAPVLAMQCGRAGIAEAAEGKCATLSAPVARSLAMKKLILETTAPFQGLPELVADKEGLFAKEGLTIEWVERESEDKSTRTDVNSPKGLDPFASHGKMLEQGKADLYNACEWGNYCRVQDTKVGSRQVGRRGIVTYAGIVVRPDSEVFTAQQLAGKNVGVPFYFGTHYLALHLLEGFMPRDQIRLCRTSNGSRERYNAMMSGEVEAVTLTEPYVSLAEKNGCRVICSAFYHGTEVASDRVDGETYAAFNRAVREAVKRINADKAAYLHYFIDYHRKDAEIAALTPADLRAGRIVVCNPAPIPADEMQRTYEWLKGWGMLEQTATPLALVNLNVQRAAHTVAAE